MEFRTLELNVISANDLNKVNLFSSMDLYVVVSFHGTTSTIAASKQKTPIDKEGGRNPYWNHSMKFTIDDIALKRDCLVLVFQTLRRRNLCPDKLVGEVHVPVKDLLSATTKTKAPQFVSYQVSKPSGKPQGVLNFSFKFVERNSPAEPVTVFPAVPTTAVPGPSTVYPPVYEFPEQYPPPPLPAEQYAPQKPIYGFPEQYPPPPPAEQYPPPKPIYADEQYPPPKPAYAYPDQYPPPPPPTVRPGYPVEGCKYGYSGYPRQWAGVPGYGYPAQQDYGYGCGYNGYSVGRAFGGRISV